MRHFLSCIFPRQTSFSVQLSQQAVTLRMHRNPITFFFTSSLQFSFGFWVTAKLQFSHWLNQQNLGIILYSIIDKKKFILPEIKAPNHGDLARFHITYGFSLQTKTKTSVIIYLAKMASYWAVISPVLLTLKNWQVIFRSQNSLAPPPLFTDHFWQHTPLIVPNK